MNTKEKEFKYLNVCDKLINYYITNQNILDKFKKGDL